MLAAMPTPLTTLPCNDSLVLVLPPRIATSKNIVQHQSYECTLLVAYPYMDGGETQSQNNLYKGRPWTLLESQVVALPRTAGSTSGV
jgi:hypothetical protein